MDMFNKYSTTEIPAGRLPRQPDWSRLVYFMMQPAVQTLQAGLEANHFSTTVGGGPFDLLSSGLLHGGLTAGDVFVWVGVSNLEWRWSLNSTQMVVRDAMRNLTAKGVLTIFYSTESFRSMTCEEKRRLPVREIWEYTRSNVLCCPDDPASQIRVRYVPPGYVPRAVVAGGARSNSVGQAVRSILDRPDAPPRFVFFGSLAPWYWLRNRCMVHITHKLTDGWRELDDSTARAAASLNRQCLNTACSLCNVSACPVVIKHSMSEDHHWDNVVGRHRYFLNVHKACEWGLTMSDPVAALNVSCESFRLAALLSAGADVFSERCHPSDEQEYDGLVRFLPIESIASSVLAAHQADPRGELAATRASERLKLFAQRFAPAAIFERAGLPATLMAHRELRNEAWSGTSPHVPEFCCQTNEECRISNTRTHKPKRSRRPKPAPGRL